MIVVNDRAVRAAIEAFTGKHYQPGRTIEADEQQLGPWRRAIEAALPHLTDAGEPLGTGEMMAAREQRIREEAFRSGIEAVLDDPGRRLGAGATRPCDVNAGQPVGSFCGCGHMVGLHLSDRTCPMCNLIAAVARQPVTGDPVTGEGPTDYEVWRDALVIAATELGVAYNPYAEGHDRDMIERAKFWRRQLLRSATDLEQD